MFDCFFIATYNMCACVHACVRVCVHVCVRACMHVSADVLPCVCL